MRVAAVTYRDVWTIETMIWLCIVTMLFVGCATHHQMGPAAVPLRYYPLLPPSSYGGTLILEQLIEGWSKGEHFQLHSQLEIDADQILVLGFTAFHTKAFALRYDGKTVDFENFTDRRIPFPAAMILSDIQKVLWPHLPDREAWHIVDDRMAKIRLVFFEGQLVTRIQYQGASRIDGNAELNDLQHGYQLSIRTLSSWGG
jgi:hypothetical protein